MNCSLPKLVRWLPFTTLIVFFVCVNFCEAAPNYVAYSFNGPNISQHNNNANYGKSSAGYFIIDPDVTPQISPNRTATYSVSGGTSVDVDTSDAVLPSYGGGGSFIWYGDPNNSYIGGIQAGEVSGGWGAKTAQIFPGTTLGQALAQVGAPYQLGDPSSTVVIQDPSFAQFTASDIFVNGKSWLNVTVAGPTITATFAPHVTIGLTNYPVSLADTAKVFGVDHFNWMSGVTIPSTWKADLKNGTTITPAGPPEKNLEDPITVIGSQYRLTNELNGKIVDIKTDFDRNGFSDFDSLPFYYNEDRNAPLFDVRNSNWTKPDRLVFQDTPGLPFDFDPGYSDLIYSTALVGVIKNPDGTTSIKPTPVYFKWRSNARIAGVDGYLSNLSPGNLGTVVGGGISDVQVFGVPEPSTLLLLAIGAISLLGYRKAKSHG